MSNTGIVVSTPPVVDAQLSFDADATLVDDADSSVWGELLRKDQLWVGHGSETAFADAILAQRRRQGLPQPGAPPLPHPYEILYKSRQLSRTRWTENESPRHVSVPVHGRSVVTCLLIAGRRIITASDDHTISIHSLPTGELIRTLKGHRGGVWSLAVTRNILVSGSTDRTVRVWDLDTGRCTHTFGGHTSTVRCVAIVRPEFIDVKQDDGTTVQEKWPKHPLIVSASRDHTLRVWALPKPGDAEFHSSVDEGGAVEDDTETNPYHKLLLEGHDDAIRGLAARGRTIVSGGYDCIVGVWDAITGTCKWVLAGHTEKVYCVALDMHRERAYSGGMDGTVQVWNLETGECQHVLRGHTSLVGLLSLSPSLLVSGSADGTQRVWDPDTGDHIETLVDSSLRPSAVTCSQHDDFKVLAGSDGALKMWDVQSGMEVRDLLQGVVGVWQVAFEGRWCVAASSNVNCTMLDIWDFAREDDAEWIGESPDGAYDEYSDVEEH